MSDETEDEWMEDFGAPALTEVQIEALLTRARVTQNVDLRRLIKEFRTVRVAAEWLLQYIESKEGPDVINNNEVLKVARFLVSRKK
jgi:hypothetical protein